MSDELTADDLEVEIRLRPPREVIDRLLVLAALCRRAFLETRPEAVADDDPETERFDLTGWLREEGLDRLATAWERRLLHTRIGRLAADEAAAASWEAEALAVLGWSLHLTDAVPPYDATADPARLLDALPSPWESTREARRTARLRPEDEIARERERAELWSWRAEVAALLATANEPERRELQAAVRDVARDALNAGVLNRLAQGDFPVRGRPYRLLDAATLDEIGAIAATRSRALDWLCGLEQTWPEPQP